MSTPFGVFAAVYFVGLVAVVLFVLTVLWRAMKAHEAIAAQLDAIAAALSRRAP